VSDFEVPNPVLGPPFEEADEVWWIAGGRPGVKRTDLPGNGLRVVRKPENV
jgi:hypothetical protein